MWSTRKRNLVCLSQSGVYFRSSKSLAYEAIWLFCWLLNEDIMADKLEQLILSIDAGPDADDESRNELTQSLRRELVELDVERVEAVHAGSAPPGAKGDPVTLATLAITLAPVAFKALIDVVQSWLSHRQDASVTLESNGKKLTITGNPSKQQQELVAAFLAPSKPGEQ